MKLQANGPQTIIIHLRLCVKIRGGEWHLRMEFKRHTSRSFELQGARLNARYTNVFSRVNQNSRYANNPWKRHYVCAFTSAFVYRHYSNFALPMNSTIIRAIPKSLSHICTTCIMAIASRPSHVYNGVPILCGVRNFVGNENIRHAGSIRSRCCKTLEVCIAFLAIFPFRAN